MVHRQCNLAVQGLHYCYILLCSRSHIHVLNLTMPSPDLLSSLLLSRFTGRQEEVDGTPLRCVSLPRRQRRRRSATRCCAIAAASTPCVSVTVVQSCASAGAVRAMLVALVAQNTWEWAGLCGRGGDWGAYAVRGWVPGAAVRLNAVCWLD